jgi:hypothetical protein
MSSTLSFISSMLPRRRAGDSSRDARREHDLAMREPGIALEHQIQIAEALSRGEGRCAFCD